jgi:hypothetical protein
MANTNFESDIDPNGFSYDCYLGDGFLGGSAEACFLDAYAPPIKPEATEPEEKAVRTSTDKPVGPKDDSLSEKPAAVSDAFKVSAPLLESIAIPVLDEFTVEAVEGPMVPQASLASTRAGSFAKFANAENDQERFQASMEYLALLKQTSGDRLNTAQQKDFNNVKAWMTSRGESVAYQQWYTASHDTNMKPAAKSAQATQYLQFVNTVYGDNPNTYPKDVREKAEIAATWHQYLKKNSSITVELEPLRKANGGVLTHDAIAQTTAGRLGFKPEDMQPYSNATNGTNRNHAFATSQDKNMTDEQWIASLQDKESITIWEDNSGDFAKMKVWAQSRHALEANLPVAERKLEEARRELSTEDYDKARAELNRQRAKLEGKEPLFDEQKGDPRIRELGAAVTQHVDELIAVPLKGLDLVTRPFQAASTAVAGTQLVIGDIFGDTFTGTQGELLEYHVTNLPGAVWERFREGKTREGFEQPIAQTYGLAAEHFGFDRNSTANKVVRTGLEIFGDPTTYVVPGMFSKAGKVAEVSTAANALRETSVAADGANALREIPVAVRNTNALRETSVAADGANALRETSVAADGANALREIPVAVRNTNALREVPLTFRAASESGETLPGLRFRLQSAYEGGSDAANLITDLEKNPIKARITETGVALEESSTRLELARSMPTPLTDDKISVVIDGARTDLKSAQAKCLEEAQARAAGASSTLERPAAAAASDAYRMEPLNPMEQTRFEKLGKKYYETQVLTSEEAAEFQSLSQRTRNRGPVMISEERATGLSYEAGDDFAWKTYMPNHRGTPGDLSVFERNGAEPFTRGVENVETQKWRPWNYRKNPNLSDEQNYANYYQRFVNNTPTDVRIYTMKDSGITISVPEDLAKQYDEVRSLRMQAAGSNNAEARAEAAQKLSKHTHGTAVLPEEVATIINNLPNRRKVTHIQLLDSRAPYDRLHGKLFDADAIPGIGQIRFFNGNKNPHSVFDTTSHEWAHMTQEGSTLSSFNAFRDAEKIETGFHSRNYAKTNEMEDFAVHFGEGVLSPDPAQFRFVVDRAPLRSVAIAEALRSELAAAQAAGMSSAYTKQLAERLVYIDNHVMPKAQEQLRQMIASGNEIQQAQAVEYLHSMAQANPDAALKLTHTQAMTDFLSTTSSSDLSDKVMPLVYENIKHHPDDAVRTFSRIYKNNTNRYLAQQYLEQYPTVQARTTLLDNQFNLMRGPNNGAWSDDIAEAMHNMDDYSAEQIFAHGYRITDAPSRARVLQEISQSCSKELAERLQRRAAAIDAGQ